MHFIIKLLKTFDYHSLGDFFKSLYPTFKYEHLTILAITGSYVGLAIDKVFGMTAIAFFAFLAIMIGELVTGIWASKINKQPFSSTRLSRFSIKAACYLLIIAVPYVLSTSYAGHGNHLASDVFDWLHVFLVIHIVFENIVSILENVGVITGKDKTFWIKKIQAKIKGL